MNTDRLLKLAEVIEANPEHFDMRRWFIFEGRNPPIDPFGMGRSRTQLILEEGLSGCGTTACIAGWAVHLWGAEAEPHRSIKENAQEILDLNGLQADWLFFGDGTGGGVSAAAAQLREMAKADASPERGPA